MKIKKLYNIYIYIYKKLMAVDFHSRLKFFASFPIPLDPQGVKSKARKAKKEAEAAAAKAAEALEDEEDEEDEEEWPGDGDDPEEEPCQEQQPWEGEQPWEDGEDEWDEDE